MMQRPLILLLLSVPLALAIPSAPARAQTGESPAPQGGPVVRDVSVYAHDREEEMPVIIRDRLDSDGKPLDSRDYITIQFDALTGDPLDFRIRFFHCDRNWRPDDNIFVNDVNHNTSFTLAYVPSPDAVRGYSYRFVNRFPDRDDAVRFDFSGNWIFRLMNRRESTTYAEGRFFVADRLLAAEAAVRNDFITGNVSPMNQSHHVTVKIPLADETLAPYYTTVDLYRNRRFYEAYRIDINDRDPLTFVDGIGRGYRRFEISSILPGNEYRTLDLSNQTRYPNYELVRPVTGLDQVRLYWRTGEDRDGIAIRNPFEGSASEYLDVLFRLDLLSSDRDRLAAAGRKVYVVGAFNDWEPREEDALQYDPAERAMTVRESLRRGIYDYQYVTAAWDVRAGRARDQDWIALEGNDWRTTNTYTAFVYYNDPRFGGFDRIAACIRVTSNGSGDPPR